MKGHWKNNLLLSGVREDFTEEGYFWWSEERL